MTDFGMKPRTGRRAAARGFTLTELMIAVTILGILSAFSLPSLKRFVSDQRVKTATSDFYASMVYARSEAIKRAADVNIVPTNTADWTAGWIVKDSGGTSLRVQDAISGVAVTGATATITFRRDGRLTAAIPIFVLKSPSDNTITARCLRIDPSGRPSIKVDTNGNPADGCQ